MPPNSCSALALCPPMRRLGFLPPCLGDHVCCAPGCQLPMVICPTLNGACVLPALCPLCPLATPWCPLLHACAPPALCVPPCPPGTIGIWPNCVPIQCPPGTAGVPPNNCVPIQVCPPGTNLVNGVCQGMQQTPTCQSLNRQEINKCLGKADGDNCYDSGCKQYISSETGPYCRRVTQSCSNRTYGVGGVVPGQQAGDNPGEIVCLACQNAVTENCTAQGLTCPGNAQLQINGANFDILVALALHQWAQIFQEKFEDWFGEKKAWAANDAYSCTMTASGNISIVYNCDGIHPEGTKGTECPGTCVGAPGTNGEGQITASCTGSFTLNETKTIKCPVSCSPGFTPSPCGPNKCEETETITVNHQSQTCYKCSDPIESCPGCQYGFAYSSSPDTTRCSVGGCVNGPASCTRLCTVGHFSPGSAASFTGYCCRYNSVPTCTQVFCNGTLMSGSTELCTACEPDADCPNGPRTAHNYDCNGTEASHCP